MYCVFIHRVGFPTSVLIFNGTQASFPLLHHYELLKLCSHFIIQARSGFFLSFLTSSIVAVVNVTQNCHRIILISKPFPWLQCTRAMRVLSVRSHLCLLVNPVLHCKLSSHMNPSLGSLPFVLSWKYHFHQFMPLHNRVPHLS